MSKINKIKLSGTTYDIQDLSATSVVNVTQAQYDALVTGGTVDPTVLYNITDAQAGDLSQYWTSAQTNSAITQAVSGKQDTLISGTNIKTINNESILGSGNIDIQGGGGGKAVSGGTNISITTGETADTINCTLSGGTLINISNNKINCSAPIRYGTGVDGVIVGASTNTNKASGIGSIANGGVANTASGQYSYAEGFGTQSTKHTSHSEGFNTTASGQYGSHAEGRNTKAINESEHASGRYNISSSASTTWGDSGNTLFSVGNGTSESARHNAFEIRQNGDIYLSSGGTDIKLQDHLGSGGGGKAVTGGTNISVTTGETADTINCTLSITATSNSFNTISVGQGSGGGSYNTLIGANARCDNNNGHNVFLVAKNSSNSDSGTYVNGTNNVIIGSIKDGYINFNIPSFTTSNSVVIGGGSISTDKDNSVAIGYQAHVSGTTKTNINNQLKIDTSNQVYIYNKDNTEMICLQDNLGGGGASYSAGTGIDITNDVISVSGVVMSSEVTSAVTSGSTDVITSGGVYDQLGGLKLVKLTQSEYDALATKDSNTLYVIVN